MAAYSKCSFRISSYRDRCLYLLWQILFFSFLRGGVQGRRLHGIPVAHQGNNEDEMGIRI